MLVASLPLLLAGLGACTCGMLSPAWPLGGAEELPFDVVTGLVSTLSACTEVSRVAPAEAASARKVDVVSCLSPVAHPRQQWPQSWRKQFLQAGAGVLRVWKF